MSETQDSDGGLIAPDDKAGFSAADVLKQAEKGDGIELEMEFRDRPFEVVRGDVVNVVEESIETDRMVRKTSRSIHVEVLKKPLCR